MAEIRSKLAKICVDLECKFAQFIAVNAYCNNELVDTKNIAAVLVLLSVTGDELKVLLTVRSAHLRRSPGEVSFPGGMKSAQDRSPAETAMREANEEIGLLNEHVHVIGCLKGVRSQYDIIIYPVVAMLIAPFIPNCNSEVDRVFYVRLSTFISHNNHASFRFTEKYDIHSFHVEGEVIFGITALICIIIAMVAIRKVPDFTMRAYRLHQPTSASGEDVANFISEILNKANEPIKVSKL